MNEKTCSKNASFHGGGAATVLLSSNTELPRLSGDLGVWLIILLELLTFAILFIAFAFARLGELEVFHAAQRTLDLHLGAVNTVLLITGSWCVASAVRAVRRDASKQGAR